jgi:hypothetical protein
MYSQLKSAVVEGCRRPADFTNLETVDNIGFILVEGRTCVFFYGIEKLNQVLHSYVGLGIQGTSS